MKLFSLCTIIEPKNHNYLTILLLTRYQKTKNLIQGFQLFTPYE